MEKNIHEQKLENIHTLKQNTEKQYTKTLYMGVLIL